MFVWISFACFRFFSPRVSGISRDSRHKRRLTGGRRNIHQKKRKYEIARPAAMTKMGVTRVRPVRVRGGNTKYRALRLESGNFSWGSECTLAFPFRAALAGLFSYFACFARCGGVSIYFGRRV